MSDVASIRECVDRYCLACAHGWGPKGIHEGRLQAIDFVDVCQGELCPLWPVRPRRGRT